MAKTPDLGPAMEKANRPPAATEPPKESPGQPGRAGKVLIGSHFEPAVQKQLKGIAVEQDTTVQNLLAEALNDLYAKYGKPEIAPVGGSSSTAARGAP